MTTSTNKTFSAAQLSYMAARALYDTQMAVFTARTADLDWDADFDAANDRDEEIRAELGISALSRALALAEDAMMDWALEASLVCARNKKQREMAIYASREGRRRPITRAKLLDLALRLAA